MLLVFFFRNDNKPKITKKEENSCLIDFSQLVEHFVLVQENHKQHRISTRTVALLEKGVKNIES